MICGICVNAWIPGITGEKLSKPICTLTPS